MTAEKYPPGWNEARVRRVLEYYESQTDEEAAAEVESALESTTMEVPTALVPAVRELLAARKINRAHAGKTHHKTRPTNRARVKNNSPRKPRVVRG